MTVNHGRIVVMGLIRCSNNTSSNFRKFYFKNFILDFKGKCIVIGVVYTQISNVERGNEGIRKAQELLKQIDKRQLWKLAAILKKSEQV